MKPKDYIIALILTLAIIFSILAADNRTTVRIKSIETSLNATQTKLSAIERVQIPKTDVGANRQLVDEIMKVTRENENLRQENKDLVTQLEAAGSFWKGGER